MDENERGLTAEEELQGLAKARTLKKGNRCTYCGWLFSPGRRFGRQRWDAALCPACERRRAFLVAKGEQENHGPVA